MSIKALVMCGGKGRRLNMGEKPMVRVGNRFLIDYVLDELWFCGEVYGVTTSNTPKTERYLRSQGIEVVRTSGKGYIEDYIEAISILGLFEPILVVSADLVILRENLILDIAEYYFSADRMALKAVNSDGDAIGINIIDGMFLDGYQHEVTYKIEENEVINVNTKEDLRRAELCLRTLMKRGRGWWKG